MKINKKNKQQVCIVTHDCFDLSSDPKARSVPPNVVRAEAICKGMKREFSLRNVNVCTPPRLI